MEFWRMEKMIPKIAFAINSATFIFILFTVIFVQFNAEMYELRLWLLEYGGVSLYIYLFSMFVSLFFKPKIEKIFFYLLFVVGILGIILFIFSYSILQPW